MCAAGDVREEGLANMFVTSLQSDLNCRKGGMEGFILIDVCYISVTENSSSLLQLPCKSKRWIADPRPTRHPDSKICTHFSVICSYGPLRNTHQVLTPPLQVFLVQQQSPELDSW